MNELLNLQPKRGEVQLKLTSRLYILTKAANRVTSDKKVRVERGESVYIDNG